LGLALRASLHTQPTKRPYGLTYLRLGGSLQ
jgi:hypothetical protein